MRRLIRWFGVFLLIYVVAYAAFRQSNVQVWEKDKQAYVIFPIGQPFLFYLFRPITYLDGALTGMRFHIGPHR